MLDCGAPSHITEEDEFAKFDETFNPNANYMELADGTTMHGARETVLLETLNNKQCLTNTVNDMMSIEKVSLSCDVKIWQM